MAISRPTLGAESPPWPEVSKLPGDGGKMVVGPEVFYKGSQSGTAGIGTIKQTTIGGRPGLVVEVIKGSPNSYDVELNWQNQKPLAKGEVVWVSLAIRATKASAETGMGAMALYGQLASPPWTAFGAMEAGVGQNWQRLETAMTADRDYAAGEAHFSIHLAQQPQTLEIADFQVRSFGVGADVNSLPQYKATYEGRELDAPWRAEADKRIDQLRKADLKILVVDPRGKDGVEGHPLAGVLVKVVQKTHAFRFGTCVTEQWITSDTPAGEKYRQILTKYFNHAVFENGLKWQSWEWAWGTQSLANTTEVVAHRAMLFRAMDWLHANGLTVRGHNMVWPAKQYLPADVRHLLEEKNVPELTARIADHITDVGQSMRGRVVEWDVVNEPVANRDIQNVLGGQSVMTEWFKLARKADPKARLVLNDYMMLSGGATRPVEIDAFYANVKRLIDEGAPIGAIGEQGHFSSNCTGMKRMLGLLDRFGSLGLPIVLTEFDINSSDEQLKADYTRDFYTAAFSHPSVDGILMWGFWEKAHWMPRAAPWSADWRLKDNGKAFIDLVYGKWWTRAEATTDTLGKATVRGFKGSYEVTVTVGGKTVTVPAEIGGDGGTVTVPVPAVEK